MIVFFEIPIMLIVVLIGALLGISIKPIFIICTVVLLITCVLCIIALFEPGETVGYYIDLLVTIAISIFIIIVLIQFLISTYGERQSLLDFLTWFF